MRGFDGPKHAIATVAPSAASPPKTGFTAWRSTCRTSIIWRSVRDSCNAIGFQQEPHDFNTLRKVIFILLLAILLKGFHLC